MGPPDAATEAEIKKWREKIEAFSKFKFDQSNFKVQQHMYTCSYRPGNKDIEKAHAIKVKSKKNRADCLFHAWIKEDLSTNPSTVTVTGY